MEKVKPFGLRLTAEQWRFITELARQTDRSRSSVVRLIVDNVRHNQTVTMTRLNRPGIGAAAGGLGEDCENEQ